MSTKTMEAVKRAMETALSSASSFMRIKGTRRRDSMMTQQARCVRKLWVTGVMVWL